MVDREISRGSGGRLGHPTRGFSWFGDVNAPGERTATFAALAPIPANCLGYSVYDRRPCAHLLSMTVPLRFSHSPFPAFDAAIVENSFDTVAKRNLPVEPGRRTLSVTGLTGRALALHGVGIRPSHFGRSLNPAPPGLPIGVFRRFRAVAFVARRRLT